MIYEVVGAPGNGKTTFASLLCIESMRDKSAKGVFTVWPVHDLQTGKISRMWRREYVLDNIFNSDIFIDEAWLYYPSRGSGRKYVDIKWIPVKDEDGRPVLDSNNKIVTRPQFETGVTHEEHMAFAGSRHNGNNFYFMTQSANRLDTIIRELVDKIYVVKKYQIPLLSRLPIIRDYFDWPLYIRVEVYIDEEGIKGKKPVSTDTLWNLPGSRLRKVFKAFDSQFMRSQGIMDVSKFPVWTTDINMKDYLLHEAGIS